MEQFDVIVIGSGFGGSVAAARLSQAGFRVLLLERGRRYEAGDFPALPDDDRLLPDLRRWVWSQDQGLWDIQDLGEIIAVQAAGYGGGSLLYANVHLRPPADTFDLNWPRKFRGNQLEPYFDLAAYMMNPAPIDEHPERSFPKTRAFETAVAGMGRKAIHPPLTITYVKGKNAFGVDQNACTGCGKCCTGCPEKAKNTLDYSYLAVAEQRGAVVRTQCEVKRLVQQPLVVPEEQRWQVEYINHLSASYETLWVKHVFVCAGVLGTSQLLREADLLSQKLKARVGLGYFPNADAGAVVYETTKECEPSRGPCITTGTTHWEPRERKRYGELRSDRFFMLQDGGYAPELERLLGILRAPLWVGRNRGHDASARPRQRPDVPRPRTPFPGVALVSPLDALLDAARDGALSDVSPPPLARSWDAFLRQVEQPLLMRFIVASTIERSAKARYESLPGWVKKCFSYQSWPVRALRWLFQRLIDFAGGNREVGHHALRGLLSGSDLNRETYLREMLGYDDRHAKRRMLLLAMGEDAAPGALVQDEQGRTIADLDLYHLIPGYTNQELLAKDFARELGGELRHNPMWSFFGKPITVHSQGGCSMSDRRSRGVTHPSGQVRGCRGLYVMDASLLCRSVGVNPTPTILAIAEHNILDFIRAERCPEWPDVTANHPNALGAEEYRRHLAGAKAWNAKAKAQGWAITPEKPATNVPLGSAPLGLTFKETFHGYCAPIGANPDPELNDAAYRLLETEARPGFPFELALEVTCKDLNRFFEDYEHRLELSGKLKLTLPGFESPSEGEDVTGVLKLLVPRDKPYALRSREQRALQARTSGYEYTTAAALATQRFMYYSLSLREDTLRLEGYKRVSDDPGLDAWRDTTALFTRFGKPTYRKNGKKAPRGSPLELLAAGVVHVDLTGFLYSELPSFAPIRGEKAEPARLPRSVTVTGTTDPARITWALAKFGAFFFGTLQRVYSPGAVNLADALFQPLPNGVRHERPISRV